MTKSARTKNNNRHSNHGRVMLDQGRFYGTATVGERGQVVIPAEARKDLHINPGDQLVVLGRQGKIIALVKAERLSEFVETIMEHVEGTGLELEVRNRMKNILTQISTNKKANN